jgi:hypothetical protein
MMFGQSYLERSTRIMMAGGREAVSGSASYDARFCLPVYLNWATETLL